jgi:hypothetical protein
MAEDRTDLFTILPNSEVSVGRSLATLMAPSTNGLAVDKAAPSEHDNIRVVVVHFHDALSGYVKLSLQLPHGLKRIVVSNNGPRLVTRTLALAETGESPLTDKSVHSLSEADYLIFTLSYLPRHVVIVREPAPAGCTDGLGAIAHISSSACS